ncbi:DUF3592 domain-containing protein [Serinicoccus sp. LYQ131]|uniref:DUF3592 domain-containing protein n=1 Tax=Serinicoccus sp. LYQ131 TaxID=3378797 RepID=UPI0038540DC9
MQNIPYLLAAGFVLVGGVLAVIGLTTVRRHLVRVRTWRREQATVVDHQWRGAGDSSTQHWVVERVTPSGAVARTVSQMGTSHGTLRGFPFPVTVLVDPADETRFVLADGSRSGWGGLFFVVGGLLLLAVGAAVGVLFFQSQASG